MSRRLLTDLATPQSLPRRPSVSGPCPAPSRFSPFARPPIFQLISSFPIFSLFHLHPYSTDEVSPPSPTPSNLRGPPSFPSTPSSHGCEGVDGKRRGAPAAAGERSGRGRKGATCLSPAARIRPAFRPGNGPTMRPIRERISGRVSEPIREPFRGPKELSRNRLRELVFSVPGPGALLCRGCCWPARARAAVYAR
jgi:hypothetical protein